VDRDGEFAQAAGDAVADVDLFLAGGVAQELGLERVGDGVRHLLDQVLIGSEAETNLEDPAGRC